MLRFNDYMQKKCDLDDQMRTTRFQEAEKVKVLEEERQQMNSQLFDEFVEKKRLNNQLYSEKIREARSGYIAQRRQIFEQSNILTVEWRAQLLKVERGEIERADIYEDTPPQWRRAA